jgi:hypothetical protein
MSPVPSYFRPSSQGGSPSDRSSSNTWTYVPLACALALVACSDTHSPSLHGSARLDIPAAYDPQALAFVPDLAAATLSSMVGHPMFPAPPGAAWTYVSETDEGEERVEVRVEADTHAVWGTDSRVLRDMLFLDDELVEDTRDWFARDADGNVWYLGEDTVTYEAGQIVCACGSWEAGVGGAQPGVAMLADPQIGDVYRQEYLPGEAEDVGEIVSLAETVSVPAGSWSNCLKTRDRSVVEPDADEYKYYCPGVGLVLEEENGARVELSKYSGL